MIQDKKRRIGFLFAIFLSTALYQWNLFKVVSPQKEILEYVESNEGILQSKFTVTIVSALYDLGRNDRPFQDYLDWMKITFQIRYPLVMFCHPKHLIYVRVSRKDKQDITKVIPESTFPLQETSNTVKSIIHELRYNHRHGPEWNCYQYIPLNFAKFKWISRAIQMNPFNTPYFYWIDAGLGRFFPQGQMALPKLHVFDLLQTDKVSIQLSLSARLPYKVTLVGSQESPFLGGIFGGGAQPLLTLSRLATEFFHNELLGKRRVDNEQVCIFKLYRRHKDLFQVLTSQNFPQGHCNVACI